MKQANWYALLFILPLHFISLSNCKTACDKPSIESVVNTNYVSTTDGKRAFTKDVLMLIDLMKLAFLVTAMEISQQIETFNEKCQMNVSADYWNEYI